MIPRNPCPSVTRDEAVRPSRRPEVLYRLMRMSLCVILIAAAGFLIGFGSVYVKPWSLVIIEQEMDTADVYDYQPEPNLECKGAQDKEWMRASLGNESGDTIHFKRWYRLAGSSTTYIDNDWVALWNNQANHMSFVRQWPDDLRAIGWDVQEEGLQPDVYVFNQANYCGY